MIPPTLKPDSLASAIVAFLADNEGSEFRCQDIARALGRPTQPTANECGRLYRRGHVSRRHRETTGRTRPVTLYTI